MFAHKYKADPSAEVTNLFALDKFKPRQECGLAWVTQQEQFGDQILLSDSERDTLSTLSSSLADRPGNHSTETLASSQYQKPLEALFEVKK